MSRASTTVSELMSTALVTMKPDETLSAADVQMRMAAIRHVPVVDDRNHLVGIVSDRDILREFGTRGADEVKVRDIMTVQVQTIRDVAPAHQAAALMLEHKISSLPVVGDEQQLVGVVTETDFLRIAHEALGGEPWEI